MSEQLLPVPPHDEPNRETLSAGARNSIRAPRPWADTETGEKRTVVFDPSDGSYQVGIPTGPTYRVPADFYAQLGGRAFSIVRQGRRVARTFRRGYSRTSFFTDDGRISLARVERVGAGDTWAITSRFPGA